MATIITRETGATAVNRTLTNAELDNNFINLNADIATRIPSSEKAAANGVATLDATGKVPSTQLPSYVDDVLEAANLAAFPATGETGKIYVALDTNKTYRWSGSTYIYITSGAVDSVAGRTGVVVLTKSDVGLGSVDNTADADKAVLTATKWASARTVSITGDISGSASIDGSANVSITGTLPASGVTAGSYGSATAIPVITVDAKGRLTLVSTVAVSIPSGSISVTGGDLTMSGSTGSAITNATLAATGVTAGTYNNVTVDAKGRVTSGSNVSYLPIAGGTLTGKVYAGSSDGDSIEVRNDTASAASSSYITFKNKNETGVYRPAARISGVNVDNAYDGDFLIETYSGGVAYKGLRVDENSNVIFYDTSGNVKFQWEAVNSRALINSNVVLHAGNYSSYALPIGGGTLSGKLTISASAGLDLYRLTFDADGTDSWYRAGSGNRHRFTTTGGADFIIGNGSGVATLNGNQLLHAGNYISYVPTRIAVEDTRAGLRTPNDYDDYRVSYEFTDQIVAGDWHTAMTIQGWHNSYSAWQIIGPASTSAHENFYLRSGVNTTWNSVRKILHSGNWSDYAAAAGHTHSYLPLTGGTLTGNLSGTTIKATSGFYHGNYGYWKTRDNGGGGQFAVEYSTSATLADANIVFSLDSSGNAYKGNYGQAYLHAGNYSSYALPLGGGTLTGGLTVPNSTSAITLASGYTIGMGDWGLRNTTPYGWIQMGPANSSWAHIYANLPFYFNQELYVNNSQVLHNGNYTGFNGFLRAAGGNDGMDFNTLAYNTMYYAYIANSANKPGSYSYPYGTILTFDPGQGTAGRAQFYISHAGNDLIFRGGWGGNGSWQTWNKVLTDQNYTNYGDGRYVLKSGDTMSGYLQVGAASTYDNPGGWGSNVVAAGQYHARFRIKATSYNGSGDQETYLWLDNTVGPATGLYSSKNTFNFNGSISTVQVAGNTVLHAGNFTDYTEGRYLRRYDGDSGSFDLNVSGQHAWVRFSTGAWVNNPYPGNYSHVLSFNAYSDNRTFQIYGGDVPGAMYVRRSQGGAGTWHPWEKVLTSYNWSDYAAAASHTHTSIVSPNGASVVAADSAFPSAGQTFQHSLALGPSGNDGHILAMSWANTASVYGAQIWLDTDPTNRMAIRSRSGSGVWNSWSEVLTELNVSSYAATPGHTHNYVLKTGDTMTGRLYQNDWIQFDNYSGLYSPLNGAHFYPNNASYGAWRIAGSRNGWNGIEFDASTTQVSLMINTDGNTVGWHANSYGWKFRWASGTAYVHKGTYGGGTEATVLDSSNYNSYSPTLTGGGASGTWSINITGNSTTVGGLPVHSGRNNQANQVVRTDGNGYIQAGWINTDSGDSGVENRLTRIYSSYDGYLRYSTLTDFKVHMGLSAKNNFSRRIDYTGDSNYWVGSFGQYGYGANETFHGGSGFFDIWSGTNYPSGTSHIHGFNALHYTTNSLGSTGGNAYGIQVAGQYDQGGLLFSRGCSGGSFSAWRRQIDDYNYNNYSPTLTGGNASGTWGINITGYAGSAGNATTADKVNSQSGYPHPGTGMYSFYNWGGSNGGASAPSAGSYTIGISVGSHPGDQAYGFQIGRNMWNAGLWTRGYDSGYGSWVRLLDSSNYSDYAATSGHNHQYNVNNDWLRENNDDAQFKIYGNTRTLIYRTDGNTNDHGGGSYAHIFYYGGSADGNRKFIINTDGNVWNSYSGVWFSDWFNQNVRTDSGPTFGDVYVNGWFRNNNSGQGMYNQSTGNHFYSDGGYWNVGYAGTNGIRLRNGHAGTVLGYLYAETSQNFGLLNSSGNWAVQVYPGSTGGGYLAGTWSGANIRATRANGNLYIDDNYGNTIVGTYSSYRYQGVFAMGDSYKLPADGTTTGSLYGIAWSHPNAGGAAGNLTDHGILVINNGSFRCAISDSIVASASITAYSDERLKTNWQDLPKDYVARLAKIKVGTYDRTDSGIRQVGVGAQSFRNLLPEAILEAKDDMKTLSVAYGNAALASAVELAKEVVTLQARIEKLELIIQKLIEE